MKKRNLIMTVCLAAALLLAACGPAYPDDLLKADNMIASVTSQDVEAIEADTAYGDIIKQLGKTQDAGWEEERSAVYLVDGTGFLYLSFADMKDKCPSSGAELLEGVQNALGIRGAVTDVSMSGGELTMLVEATGSDYGMYDKASVRVGADTVVVKQNGDMAAVEQIKTGDNVEVVFSGPVAESYPVQGRALRVTILDASAQ